MRSLKALLAPVAIVAAASIAPLAAHPGLHHDIEKVTARIAQEPGRTGLYLERAVYYRLDGQHEKALADLEIVRRDEPSNPVENLERGLNLSALGRDGEAEAALSLCIDRGHAGAVAWAERARVRARTGRREGAIADYTAAIAIQPEIDWYLERGALLEASGRPAEAAAAYRDGVARLGGAVNLRHALIRAEIAAGRPEEALKAIDEGMARVPIKTEWMLQRADLLAGMGRTQEARAQRESALVEANRALERKPTAIHLVSRAKVHLALGNEGGARSDLETAIEKAPRFTAARELLAGIPGDSGVARAER